MTVTTGLPSGLVPRHDEPEYLDFAGVAEMTGLAAKTVAWQHRMGLFPAPDITLERTPGWRPRTIRAWLLEKLQAKAPGLELVSPDPAEDTNPPPQYLDSTACAEMAGVTRGTWNSYWHSGHAPEPEIQLGRSHGWRLETVQEWMQNRPGAGYRSDIHGDA